MRTDKIAPKLHNTVLGTLLELAESLTADELRVVSPPESEILTE
jgi:hypothetical protein